MVFGRPMSWFMTFAHIFTIQKKMYEQNMFIWGNKRQYTFPTIIDFCKGFWYPRGIQKLGILGVLQWGDCKTLVKT